MNTTHQKINTLLALHDRPQREPLSKKYPFTKEVIIALRRTIKHAKNNVNPKMRNRKRNKLYSHTIFRHQSLLRRKLGTGTMHLQEQKITNLKKAAEKLNHLVIPPGHIFSLWKTVGKPTYKKGYVDGMLLSNGKVLEGLGGGLCQMSNLLYWMFLHGPFEIVERHHHSKDVFPDSGRTLPFGSGATVFYNYLDLQVKNISPYPIQLEIWVTDTHLKGKILSGGPNKSKYHIFEKNHCFIKRGDEYFRYNEIFREERINGDPVTTKPVTKNFAPVLYEVTDEYLKENRFKVLNVSPK